MSAASTGLVCFCGIDGSGKSSHLRAVSARLRARGVPLRVLKLISTRGRFFRTASPLFSTVDRKTYCDLFAFERYQAVQRRVVPELARGDRVVLCDRYLYTDVAYAYGHGHGTSFAETLVSRAPKPDLTLMFHVPPAVALERIHQRAPRATPRTLDFLSRAAERYEQIAVEVGAVMIDTVQPFEHSVDESFRSVAKFLDPGVSFDARRSAT